MKRFATSSTLPIKYQTLSKPDNQTKFCLIPYSYEQTLVYFVVFYRDSTAPFQQRLFFYLVPKSTSSRRVSASLTDRIMKLSCQLAYLK